LRDAVIAYYGQYDQSDMVEEGTEELEQQPLADYGEPVETVAQEYAPFNGDPSDTMSNLEENGPEGQHTAALAVEGNEGEQQEALPVEAHESARLDDTDHAG